MRPPRALEIDFHRAAIVGRLQAGSWSGLPTLPGRIAGRQRRRDFGIRCFPEQRPLGMNQLPFLKRSLGNDENFAASNSDLGRMPSKEITIYIEPVYMEGNHNWYKYSLRPACRRLRNMAFLLRWFQKRSSMTIKQLLAHGARQRGDGHMGI